MERMGRDRQSRRALYSEVGRVRRVGRPRTRWLQEVETDWGRMGIKNWRRRPVERSMWRRIVEKNAGLSVLEEAEECHSEEGKLHSVLLVLKQP